MNIEEIDNYLKHNLSRERYEHSLGVMERAEEYAARFGVKIIDSFEEALASDKINSIAIFTQRTKHGSMVIESLKAGKHVN